MHPQQKLWENYVDDGGQQGFFFFWVGIKPLPAPIGGTTVKILRMIWKLHKKIL